jgi:hypothetical protein
MTLSAVTHMCERKFWLPGPQLQSYNGNEFGTLTGLAVRQTMVLPTAYPFSSEPTEKRAC